MSCGLRENCTNFRLSDAKNVVLIGHGTGCQAVMEMVNHCDVEKRVKAVVQVAGLHSLVRVDPHDEPKRKWFAQSNRIYVPSIHPLLAEQRLHRRLGGQIFTSEKAKVVDVLNDVLPQIKEFVEASVPKTVKKAPAIGNGHSEPQAIPEVVAA